ncbi:MAG: MerR family transcriptional regulator [Oceanicaulis sp.]
MADKSPEAYRTISEAGAEAGLPAHVLRFWESKFAQLKPVKRAGGRRLYRPQDVALLKGLRRLLYEEGYTIKGAQKYLKDHGVAHVSALGEGSAVPDTPATAPAPAEPEGATETAATESGADREITPAPAIPTPNEIHPEVAERLRRAYDRVRAAREVLQGGLQ